MSGRSLLKRLPGIKRLSRIVSRGYRLPTSPSELGRLSSDELLSLMRHESHRIEKAAYNDILDAKRGAYLEARGRLVGIYSILEARGFPADEPTLLWSREIYSGFDELPKEFIERKSTPAPELRTGAAGPFVEFLRARRSVRVWADKQPDPGVLREIARSMIEAARWAPNSGNRQAWRFRVLETPEEKSLLKGLKENHCVGAPLLIFVGVDTRLYGALGKRERGIFLDAGAAIMQMLLVAHKCGLGGCWNHFADDLINSRKANQRIYAEFADQVGIPRHITPIAVVALGAPKFIPPEPARMDPESLLISPAGSPSPPGGNRRKRHNV